MKGTLKSSDGKKKLTLFTEKLPHETQALYTLAADERYLIVGNCYFYFPYSGSNNYQGSLWTYSYT